MAIVFNNKLKAGEADNILAYSDNVYDKTQKKMQNTINSELYNLASKASIAKGNVFIKNAAVAAVEFTGFTETQSEYTEDGVYIMLNDGASDYLPAQVKTKNSWQGNSYEDGTYFVAKNNGHLYRWDNAVNNWVDLGRFTGESAYEIAERNGLINGDEIDFIASLKGARGERGEAGAKGDSIAPVDGTVPVVHEAGVRTDALISQMGASSMPPSSGALEVSKIYDVRANQCIKKIYFAKKDPSSTIDYGFSVFSLRNGRDLWIGVNECIEPSSSKVKSVARRTISNIQDSEAFSYEDDDIKLYMEVDMRLLAKYGDVMFNNSACTGKILNIISVDSPFWDTIPSAIKNKVNDLEKAIETRASSYELLISLNNTDAVKGVLVKEGTFSEKFTSYRTSQKINIEGVNSIRIRDLYNPSGTSFSQWAFFDENDNVVSNHVDDKVYAEYRELLDVVPTGAKTLRVSWRFQELDNKTTVRTPIVYKGVPLDIFKYDKEIESIKAGVLSWWQNKSIVWFGTSIPEGGYPQRVGRLLNATMYNEALGSSCSSKYYGNKQTWEHVTRQMGQTIQEKIAVFNNIWVVDDEKQTVSAGQRDFITDTQNIPNITTYQQAVDWRSKIISYSFEIKLIAKYLLANKVEHANFLKEKFGSMYNKLIELHPNAYSYVGDVDLFVFDHGTNDAASATPINKSSEDMTTFIGAINTYIRWIKRYKTRTPICILGVYMERPSGITEATQAIADYWNLPFFDAKRNLPMYNMNVIEVQGYWDSNQIWHDTGFTWSESGDSFTTNLNLKARCVGGATTLSAVKSKIKPSYHDGKWWWSTNSFYTQVFDGLHPHTDKTDEGVALDRYARTLAKWLSTVSL